MAQLTNKVIQGGAVNLQEATATIQDVLQGKKFYGMGSNNMQTGMLALNTARVAEGSIPISKSSPHSSSITVDVAELDFIADYVIVEGSLSVKNTSYPLPSAVYYSISSDIKLACGAYYTSSVGNMVQVVNSNAGGITILGHNIKLTIMIYYDSYGTLKWKAYKK